MTIRGSILLILVTVGLLPLISFSQNLIPNPGFEDHSGCTDPPQSATLQNCDHWFNAVNPLTTVDWYSSCFPSSSPYQTPDIYFGYSYPQSGEAMVGFIPYSNLTLAGEAIGVKLIAPLIKDSAYCFDFWLKNSKNHNNQYAMYEFDVAFLTDTANITDRSQVTNYITLNNDANEEGWEQLSGYYIASGGEQFFVMGSFKPNPGYYMADPVTTPENYIYYYFDNFSLEPCNKDSILEVFVELPNVFTPNGDGDNNVYEIRKKNLKVLDVTVLNRWGNVVKQYDGIAEVWDGTDRSGTPVSEGVYFVRITAESRFGELISKQQSVQVFR